MPMSENPIEWREPAEGFEFEPDTVVVSGEHQAEKLTACGLDPRVFGDYVDISFYIGLGIHAGIRNGISAEGNVNMLQSLTQNRPIRLGEALTVKGYIRKITEVPRGLTVDTEVWFEDGDGIRVVGASRRSLKPDPEKIGVKGAGDRPAPVIDDVASLTRHSTYQLTPEKVKRYSMEGNSIHYEMEAAEKAGFRAPLIGGGMGVHYMMATLWQQFDPDQVELDIYFRRPIFWDDAFNVIADPSSIGLVKEGKVLTEARINTLC
jgi:hypothetical protein